MNGMIASGEDAEIIVESLKKNGDILNQVRAYKIEDICRYVDHIEEARMRLKRKMLPEYAMKELLLAITE